MSAHRSGSGSSSSSSSSSESREGGMTGPELLTALDLAFNHEDEQVEAEHEEEEENEVEEVNATSTTAANNNEAALTSKKRPRKRATVSRPIDPANLDIVDEIILRMKKERRSDKDVAEHLSAEGHVDYVAKTIGTRYARLCKKIAEYNDQQLDKGETNWTASEDLVLIEARTRARARVAKQIAEMESKIWQYTASYAKEANADMVYSTRAFRERFEQISGGQIDWYPELQEIQSYTIAVQAEEDLEEARNELQRAQNDQDQEIRNCVLAHLNDDHDEVESDEQVLKSGESESEDQDSSSSDDSSSDSDSDKKTKASSFGAGLDTKANGLPTWVNRDIRTDQQVEDAFKRLENEQLPPVSAMHQPELAAELKARGFQSNGKVDKLRSLVRRARSGKTDIPKAVGTPDIPAFLKMLKERRVWVLKAKGEGDDEDDEGSGESKSSGSTTKASKSNVLVIPRNLPVARKRGTKRRISEVEIQDEKDEREEKKDAKHSHIEGETSSTSFIPVNRVQTTANPSRKKAKVATKAAKTSKVRHNKKSRPSSSGSSNPSFESDDK